ncbi:FUSC family protein [Catenulispora sp. NF23]|uniref:FUSC family protein n=1 Tax=Catenulispora pinistramenti TaxID=2705254 RepID=UPI001BAA8E96|nr:FUSC family protein [Catenulispora pinistramenti]MBS2536423.1 FUSC family protein [Catenulispora pinistramenti]
MGTVTATATVTSGGGGIRAGALRELWDRVVASDPGLVRARMAVSAAVAMSVTLGIEFGYAKAQHDAARAILVAMMLGGMVAIMGAMALTGTASWPKVRTAVFFPVAFGAGMLPGALVAGRTDAMLSMFVVVMFAAVWVRRFGPAFFFYGFMMFMGYFFAAFLGAKVSTLPTLMADLAVGTGVSLLLALTVLRQHSGRTLTRLRGAFAARAGAVARACADLLEARGDARRTLRAARRLHSRGLRLAETALVIEGWLAEPGSTVGDDEANALRRRLLDAQLALDELAHAADALARHGGQPGQPGQGGRGGRGGQGGQGGQGAEAAIRAAELIARREYAAARSAALAILEACDVPAVGAHDGFERPRHARAVEAAEVAEVLPRPRHARVTDTATDLDGISETRDARAIEAAAIHGAYELVDAVALTLPAGADAAAAFEATAIGPTDALRAPLPRFASAAVALADLALARLDGHPVPASAARESTSQHAASGASRPLATSQRFASTAMPAASSQYAASAAMPAAASQRAASVARSSAAPQATSHAAFQATSPAASQRPASAKRPPAASQPFAPAVVLIQGRLPGSVAVAGALPARGRWNPLSRASLPTRQAVQVALAGALAIVLGRHLSETRYYWAVIAAFVAFGGTATRSETSHKALARVLGTSVGIAVGLGLGELTSGHTLLSVVVIVASMSCGFYVVNLTYAGMIFFVTIMVAQLYGVLHELSSSLLELRLKETALGALVGIIVGLVVLPTSTRDTLDAAERAFFDSVIELLRASAAVLDDADEPAYQDLSGHVRAMEERMRQLALVARPMTRPLISGTDTARVRERLAGYASIARRARALADVPLRLVGDRTSGAGLAGTYRALAASIEGRVVVPGASDSVLR